jgi:hypothetical protein
MGRHGWSSTIRGGICAGPPPRSALPQKSKMSSKLTFYTQKRSINGVQKRRLRQSPPRSPAGRHARMTARLLRRTGLGALLWLGAWIVATHAHQNSCHRRHACPSDSQTYVCGDKGRCDQCPDNQYCLAGKSRMTSSSTPTPAPLAPWPSTTTTPSAVCVLHRRRELYECHCENPGRREAHDSGTSLFLHLGTDRQSATVRP